MPEEKPETSISVLLFPAVIIQNQHNYIQINGTVLSQEAIKHLNAEQLSTIETILKTALPQIAQ